MKQNWCFIRHQMLGAALVVAAASMPLTSTATQAATVSGGALTLNLDRNAMIAGVVLDNFPDTPTADFPICCRPSIYVEEFFDASVAASRTFTQLLNDNTPNLEDSISDEIPATGLQFSVNGATVPTNLLGRVNKATTLNFDPANMDAGATGRIGFGGVIRFRVDDIDPPKNRVLLGDMALEYDPELVDSTMGRSGWVLMNYIGFRISGFDLFDVSTSLNGTTLTMSGNLGLGEGFDHLGGIRDTRVGTFSLQTTVVPIPSAIWLFASGLVGLRSLTHRKTKVRS